MATPGSCTDDNPQTSPTYERRWLAQCFSDWSKPRQNFESLDENRTWLAIRGTRACVTCTELQQSGMGLEPRQGPHRFLMRHPLCAVPFFCYSPTSEPTGFAHGDGYRTASNTKKITDDGSVRIGRRAQKSASYLSLPYAHEGGQTLRCTKEDGKHKTEAKIRWWCNNREDTIAIKRRGEGTEVAGKARHWLQKGKRLSFYWKHRDLSKGAKVMAATEGKKKEKSGCCL